MEDIKKIPGYFRDQFTVSAVISEQVAGKNLVDAVNDRDPEQTWLSPGPELATCVASQVCSALTFLHQRGILFHDLKVENLIIDEKADAFSLGALLMMLTCSFTPAEISLSERDRGQDVVHHLHRAYWFSKLSDREKEEVLTGLFPTAFTDNAELLELMIGLLRFDAKERLGVQEAGKRLEQLATTYNHHDGKPLT